MTEFPEHIKSVCVYCGSANRVAQIYKDSAISLAEYLVGNGRGIVYGGGRVGMMGLVADTGIAKGGSVVGIIPEYLVYKEVQHEHLTEMHVVDTMHTRKKMMVDKADAFVILPGGYGTLDEAFEIMTWKQLGLHEKPVVFVNINGYWDSLFAMMDKIAEEQFSGAESKNLCQIITTVEELAAALAKQPDSPLDPKTKWM